MQVMQHTSTVYCPVVNFSEIECIIGANISLLRGTIEYYNENGSHSYLLLLDASKAFHRVEYVRLFRTLSDRNM